MAKTPRRRQPAPAKKQPRNGRIRIYVRYSPKIAREICERIAEGGTWSRICKDAHMPSYSALYGWCERHPEFADALTRARVMAADGFADQVLEVAQAATSATASGDRLHVGALQWRAAKAAPHVYGRKAEERVEQRRIIVEVRKFQKVIGPDGRTYLREIPKLNEAANDD
jgi:hypothetical protein